MQQLDREKELVRHSKEEAGILREKCQVINLDRKRDFNKIQRMRQTQVGYQALHEELSVELNKMYVYESLIKYPENRGDT